MPTPPALWSRSLLIIAALVGGATEDAPRPASEETTAGLYHVLDVLRDKAGLAALERSDPLQRLADSRAARIAFERTKRRMRHPVPLDDALDGWPELAGLRLIERVVLVPPSLEGAARLRAAWDNPEAGAPALDPDSFAVGLGAWVAQDGTLVFLALFQSGRLLTDREVLERAVLDQINEIRLEHGLAALKPNAGLREIARAHSDVMLAGAFLGHESDGLMPVDRVRAAGIEYRLIGENVAHSLRSLGAVHGVVEEWMASPLHRHNILTPDFSDTGVGAAIGADGTIYLTQLFRDP